MSMVEQQSWVEQTRPQRVDALMWVAERAHILADAYAVRVSGSWEGPEVFLQGEAGALHSLVERFGAALAERQRDGYTIWQATDEGVRVEFIEESGVAMTGQPAYTDADSGE